MENWASVEHETRMGQSVSFFANKNHKFFTAGYLHDLVHIM